MVYRHPNMARTLFAPGARFTLVTLGCKVNQYESHALREAWLARGLVEASRIADADFVCVNSCAVTARAVADVRAAVRRAGRDAPRAAVILTGCAARLLRDELADLPAGTVVIPQASKADLLSLNLLSHRAGRGTDPHGVESPEAAPPGPPEPSPPCYPPFAVAGYDRSRALVKVQEGCSHRCTYCIVPLTRGPSRSRPLRDTLAEVRRLLDAGFREITLSGINLAQYGRDSAPPHDFWDLTAHLDAALAPEWAGRARLRLSSLEPGQLGPKALDTLAKAALVAPHIHLSLQSGSSSVLRRMGRGHYDPAALPDFCAALARIWPRFGLGADILSGFPGETDAEALETETLVKALPFTYAHVFPYSPRPGTPAASWPGQADARVKKTRSARLRRLLAGKKEAFLRGCLSLPRVFVACEGSANPDGESMADAGGVNEFYSDCLFAPSARPAPELRRSLVPARPAGVDKGRLLVTYIA